MENLIRRILKDTLGIQDDTKADDVPKPQPFAERQTIVIDAIIKKRFGPNTRWVYLDAHPMSRFLRDEDIPIKVESGKRVFIETLNGIAVGLKEENRENAKKEEERTASFLIAQKADEWLAVHSTDIAQKAHESIKKGYSRLSFEAPGVDEDVKKIILNKAIELYSFHGGEIRRGKLLFNIQDFEPSPKTTTGSSLKEKKQKKSDKVLKIIALNYLSDNKERLTAQMQEAILAGGTLFRFRPKIEKDALDALKEALGEENSDFISKVSLNGSTMTVYFRKNTTNNTEETSSDDSEMENIIPE